MRSLYCQLDEGNKGLDLGSICWWEKVDGKIFIELSNGARKEITEEELDYILAEGHRRRKLISLPLIGLLIVIAGGLGGVLGYGAQEEEPQLFVYENGQCIVRALNK